MVGLGLDWVLVEELKCNTLIAYLGIYMCCTCTYIYILQRETDAHTYTHPTLTTPTPPTHQPSPVRAPFPTFPAPHHLPSFHLSTTPPTKRPKEKNADPNRNLRAVLHSGGPFPRPARPRRRHPSPRGVSRSAADGGEGDAGGGE